METTSFTPQLGDLYALLACCLGVFVTLFFLAWRFNKIESTDPRKRVLLPMLCYFLALLCLMGAAGAFWSTTKFPNVEIAKASLTIDGERYPRPRKSEIRIQENDLGGLGGPNRVLLVQTKDKRTWAFPEDRYDILTMLRLLR